SNFTTPGPCPRPGPIAITVFPLVSDSNSSGVMPFAATCPAAFAGSGDVINSGAITETGASTGAGTAAVTRPAPARIAVRDVMAGAPDLPRDPPITSTWPNLPLFESAARGHSVSACALPAHVSFSSETIAASGEPIGATTIG